MNTPAHMIFGAALFGRAATARAVGAAAAGGLLPDVPLMVMVGWSIWVRGVPAQTVFDTYYFSASWQAVFAVDHNFLLWGGMLLAALCLRRPVFVAFAGSGLLHASVDFLVHHDDARSQFWPLTLWKFQSPVSYWDKAHYGQCVGPMEIIISLLLCGLLWRRFTSAPARAMIALAALAEAAPTILFSIMMSGGPK